MHNWGHDRIERQRLRASASFQVLNLYFLAGFMVLVAFGAFFPANIVQKLWLALQFIALLLGCKIHLSSHLLLSLCSSQRGAAKINCNVLQFPYLTAEWRRNVLYLMTLQRGDGKNNREWRITARTGVTGECWLCVNVHVQPLSLWPNTLGACCSSLFYS